MDPLESQMQLVFNLRSRGITNADVLKAMEAIPRARFLEGIFADRAHEDTPLPIACGQTISQPTVVGLMTQALQAVHYPDKLLKEMLRVGRECIITFPNFGHWRCRWYLASKGRMPVSEFLPYTWYNTPNIHFCTFQDFERLCRQLRMRVLDRRFARLLAEAESAIPGPLT